MLNEREQVRPAPEVLFRQVGGEAVLLDLEQGRYYGLDDVGCRVWNLLVEGAEVRDMVATLVREYEVDAKRAASDVDQLLESLTEAGLLTMATVS